MDFKLIPRGLCPEVVHSIMESVINTSNNFQYKTLYNSNGFRSGSVGLNNSLYNTGGYQTGRIDNYYGRNIIRNNNGYQTGEVLGNGSIINSYGTTVGNIGGW